MVDYLKGISKPQTILNTCNEEFCSHPSCWSYYRQINKRQDHQNNYPDQNCKNIKIDIPYQNIVTLKSSDLLNNTTPGSTQIGNYERQNQLKNNSIINYLLSRNSKRLEALKKSEFIEKDKSQSNQVAKLNVHEVFDEDELDSDWRSTFKSKDFYIWIPSQKTNKVHRERRNMKTPTLQLAPITDSCNASTKNLSSCRMSSSRISSSLHSIDQLQRSSLYDAHLLGNHKSKKTFGHFKYKYEMEIDPNRLKPASISMDPKSEILQHTITNQKMPIYQHRDKVQWPSKSEFLSNNYEPDKIYKMDESSIQHEPFILLPSKSVAMPSSRLSNYSIHSNSSLTSSLGNEPRGKYRGPLKLKRIGAANGWELRHIEDLQLAPHRTPNSLNTSRQSSAHSSLDEGSLGRKIISQYKHSPGRTATDPVDKTPSEVSSLMGGDADALSDSLLVQANSSRSTLLDEDILPGNSMLNMLQQSYQLMYQRSEHNLQRAGAQIFKYQPSSPDQLEHKEPQMLLQSHNESNTRPNENLAEYGDDEVDDDDIPRTVQSAPINLLRDSYGVTTSGGSSAPPPSPDISARQQRSISALPAPLADDTSDEEDHDI